MTQSIVRQTSKTPKTLPKPERLASEFKSIWEKLMLTPIHLDSALSKLLDADKRVLAQIIPRILSQPVSLAEYYGVGVPRGEPWSLSQELKAQWRPAQLLFQSMYQKMDTGIPEITPVREDFPPDWIKDWETQFGVESCDRLVVALGTRPPLTLRASRSVTPSDLRASLENEKALSCKSWPSEISPQGLVIDKFCRVQHTKAYESGHFEIQDEGSQVMAYFSLWPEIYGTHLSKTPGKISGIISGILLGKTVEPPKALPERPSGIIAVDACAGAGGKALAISDAVRGKGRIFAFDISQPKLDALSRRATRLKLNNIQARIFDPSRDEKFFGTADLVLVDAPCSGHGVLKRNPDIKWRKYISEKADQKPLPEIQFALLETYSRFVKPGGRLVYGLCTFTPEETQGVVDRFSKLHPEFIAKSGGYCGPSESGDGFFMHYWELKA